MSMAVYIHLKSPSNLMAFLEVYQPACCGVQVLVLRSTSFDAVAYKSFGQRFPLSLPLKSMFGTILS